jgi:ribose-phosphate pyrophosphokinase
MTPVVLALPSNDALARTLAQQLDAEPGQFTLRRFPDGESYVRIETELTGRAVVVVGTLAQPDEKFLPLVFLAATARDLGAETVELLAPYLAYLRQDHRFQPGEAVTSRYFARLVSGPSIGS